MATSDQSEAGSKGFHPLFDGTSLNGWKTTGNPDGWIARDGCIVCLANKGGYIYTEEKYENYVLKLEFNIGPEANSGIFLRLSDLADPVNTGIEVQILDDFTLDVTPVHQCGGLYDMVAPSEKAMKPLGEWNQVTITCDGPVISVQLNGRPVAGMNVDDYDTPGKNPDGTDNKFKYAWKDMPRNGHIALQDHNSEVMFRNIEIKIL